MSQQNNNQSSMLRVGTILRGIYRIDKQLASGGFGNTYKATNIEFDEVVAIKEFFMKDACLRNEGQNSISITYSDKEKQFTDQLAKFKKEARRIRQLHNEHIVNVHDLFDENGTAYYVMDYIDGESLDALLKRTGQPLSETEVRNIMCQLLEALKCVHEAGLWHLDLKPGNVMLDKRGNVTLIDFGASKQIDRTTGGATALTKQTRTEGYAPYEQIEENYSKYGPWTDIYALGATLYALLTNRHPPLPSDIDDDESADKHEALPFPDSVSDEMRKMILHMMKTNRTKRPQSVDEIIFGESEHTNSKSIIDNATLEETIVASPSKTKVYNNDEETILVREKTEEKEQQLPLNNYEYEGNDTGKGPIIKIILIVFAIIVLLSLFFIIRKSTNRVQADDIDPLLENVDTLPDPIPSQDPSPKPESLVTIETILGKCSYAGDVDNNGKPHGYGEAHFLDGRFYKGNWEHGELTGFIDGYFKYSNGDTFVGTFDNNMFFYGVYTVAEDGSYFDGFFWEGKPDNGKWYDKDGNVLEVLDND